MKKIEKKMNYLFSWHTVWYAGRTVFNAAVVISYVILSVWCYFHLPAPRLMILVGTLLGAYLIVINLYFMAMIGDVYISDGLRSACVHLQREASKKEEELSSLADQLNYTISLNQNLEKVVKQQAAKLEKGDESLHAL